MKKRGKNEAAPIKDVAKLKQIQHWLKFNDYRAYILFMIGLVTGYRGSDVIKLTVGDLREALKIGSIEVLEQKTVNTRKVTYVRSAPLNSKLRDIISDFTNYKEDAEYVYPKKGSKFKQHIARDRLGKIYKKAATECGIDEDLPIGTHTPRKNYGLAQYLKQDKDLEYVRALFGHSKLSTTRTYIGLGYDIAGEAAETMEEYMA